MSERVPEAPRPVSDDQVGKAHLHRERRPQRPGRNDVAIAEAAIRASTTAIERSFASTGFCKSIVHDDDGVLRGDCLDRLGAFAAVARDDGRRVTRASSSGSSPTSPAVCIAGSTRTGPSSVPP